MNHTLRTVSKGVLCSLALALGLLAAPAQAQIEITIFPPAIFRATTRPVYYEGRATYWYQGRWYYQEGRSWRSYRDEPRFLRESRGAKKVPMRKHYEQRKHRRGHGR